MKILIINPICYTSETKRIKRIETIKDTMIYDLCLAFNEKGHKVTLYAAEPYQPVTHELYPFEIVWGKCRVQSIFHPNVFPLIPSLIKHLKQTTYDLIISSEVFSLCSLMAVLYGKRKVIIWHELAKHQAKFRRIASKCWYNFVASIFMKNTVVVARSNEAKRFIQRYCLKTSMTVIDHGVNLNKFIPSCEKSDYFVVCSQLIKRKRIDGIIDNYFKYRQNTDSKTTVYIIGDGELKEELETQTRTLGLEKNISFLGKMRHEELIPFLARAKALLINTEKDNNMISIIESLAVCTPVLTTDIPLNSSYIKAHGLGICKKWGWKEMSEINDNNEEYVKKCFAYRDQLSNIKRVDEFISVANGFS